MRNRPGNRTSVFAPIIPRKPYVGGLPQQQPTARQRCACLAQTMPAIRPRSEGDGGQDSESAPLPRSQGNYVNGAPGATALEHRCDRREKSGELVSYGSIALGEASMRLVYLMLIILFAAAAVVFVIQNRDTVTISFLGLSASAPVAILSAIMYLLGAMTGGSLFGLLRHSARRL